MNNSIICYSNYLIEAHDKEGKNVIIYYRMTNDDITVYREGLINTYIFTDGLLQELSEEEKEYNFAFKKDNYLLHTVIDNSKDIDTSELTNYISNLKLPINMVSFIKNLGDKFLILDKKINVTQKEVRLEIDTDTIKLDNSKLNNCQISTDLEIDNGVLALGKPNEWYFKKNFTSSNGDDVAFFEVKNISGCGHSINLYTNSNGTFEGVPTCNGVYKEAKEVYEKTRKKLPSWIKIN